MGFKGSQERFNILFDGFFFTGFEHVSKCVNNNEGVLHDDGLF